MKLCTHARLNNGSELYTCCKSLVSYTVHKVPTARAPRLLYYRQVLPRASAQLPVQTDRMIPLHSLVPSSTF
jgi:hypothetical protein